MRSAFGLNMTRLGADLRRMKVCPEVQPGAYWPQITRFLLFEPLNLHVCTRVGQESVHDAVHMLIAVTQDNLMLCIHMKLKVSNT